MAGTSQVNEDLYTSPFSGATSELRECRESLARQRHQQTATDATATWLHTLAMSAMSGGFQMVMVNDGHIGRC